MISVIVPVYNGEKYLAAAIDSVLCQAYSATEILVVDDGSVDGSAQVAQGFGDRVRYFHQPNRGIGAARNRGIEIAKGAFFAFLDADDLWEPRKLALQMAALEEDASLDAVFGHVVQFVTPEMDEGERAGLFCPTAPVAGYVAGTMLIRRDSFFRAGMFSTALKVGEFIDWYARAMESGMKHAMLPDVVTRRRLHGNNTTVRERQAQPDYVHILKASLDRRRARGT
jgi:glycosyltransferase involved in cell wall biosynthesis